MFNNTEVTSFRDVVEWERQNLLYKIMKAQADTSINSIILSDIKHSTQVTSELLDLLSMAIEDPTKLQKLKLEKFPGLKEGLAAEVIEKFAAKATRLQELEIRDMNRFMGTEALDSIGDLACRLIENSEQLTVVILTDSWFSKGAS